MSFQPSIAPGKIHDLVPPEWIVSGEKVVLNRPIRSRQDASEHSPGEDGAGTGAIGTFLHGDAAGGAAGGYRAGSIDEKFRELNKPRPLILDVYGFVPFSPLWGHALFG